MSSRISGQISSRPSHKGAKGSRAHGDVRSHNTNDMGNDPVEQENRTVSQDARSRKYLAERLNDSNSYAQFAAAAGADIFDGEPIKPFDAVGKMDERTLRFRTHELRVKVLDLQLAERAGRSKQITG